MSSPTVRAALKLTLERFPEVSASDLLGPSRLRKHSRPRSFAMAILKAKGWSFQQVASAFNREDHTTAIYGVKTVAAVHFADVDFDELASQTAKAAAR